MPVTTPVRSRLPAILRTLTLPAIGAPMFTVSYPELVLAECKAGIVGAFPALNAREPEVLDQWLTDIERDLASWRAAHPNDLVGPLAVNQIVHRTNTRLERDMATCVRHRVPILITSLRAPVPEVIAAVHAYGGIVLHDVISMRHAEKAIEAGVDGLILVATGAGGHGGNLSPFALVGEVRQRFQGPLILAGSIVSGAGILAAQAMGADLAYIGTRFIASAESHASTEYKQSLLRASAKDIVYSNFFTGVNGNYVRESIARAGLDPDALPIRQKGDMTFAAGSAKAWKDIWGAGQGVGQIDDLPSTAEIVATLRRDYAAARAELSRSR